VRFFSAAAVAAAAAAANRGESTFDDRDLTAAMCKTHEFYPGRPTESHQP